MDFLIGEGEGGLEEASEVVNVGRSGLYANARQPKTLKVE